MWQLYSKKQLVRLGYKFLFYKRFNHEESFRTVQINRKNLVK